MMATYIGNPLSCLFTRSQLIHHMITPSYDHLNARIMIAASARSNLEVVQKKVVVISSVRWQELKRALTIHLPCRYLGSLAA